MIFYNALDKYSIACAHSFSAAAGYVEDVNKALAFQFLSHKLVSLMYISASSPHIMLYHGILHHIISHDIISCN